MSAQKRKWRRQLHGLYSSVNSYHASGNDSIVLQNKLLETFRDNQDPQENELSKFQTVMKSFSYTSYAIKSIKEENAPNSARDAR